MSGIRGKGLRVIDFALIKEKEKALFPSIGRFGSMSPKTPKGKRQDVTSYTTYAFMKWFEDTY